MLDPVSCQKKSFRIEYYSNMVGKPGISHIFDCHFKTFTIKVDCVVAGGRNGLLNLSDCRRITTNLKTNKQTKQTWSQCVCLTKFLQVLHF